MPEKKEGLTVSAQRSIRTTSSSSRWIRYFRPVDVTTAPDGTVYITDILPRHHPGRELRRARHVPARAGSSSTISTRSIHKGRIWRLGLRRRQAAIESDALVRDRIVPRMNNETPAQLVTHLSHPNGWWRDTAQQLLVLEAGQVGRAFAAPDDRRQVAEPAGALPRDVDARRTWRAQAGARARADGRTPSRGCASRRFAPARRSTRRGDRSFAADYAAMTKDADVDVVIQALLTINRWKAPDAAATTKTMMEGNSARGVQVVGDRRCSMLRRTPPRADAGAASFTRSNRASSTVGGQIYNELCFACHWTGRDWEHRSRSSRPRWRRRSRDRRASTVTATTSSRSCCAALDGSRRRQDLHGHDDRRWAARTTSGSRRCASFVRNNFGNSGGFITPADVARVRADTAGRQGLLDGARA